jgi:hypothetical protein
MWQGGPLANFKIFFFILKKKGKSKNCHINKDDEELYFKGDDG